jgi:hypothetical protein
MSEEIETVPELIRLLPETQSPYEIGKRIESLKRTYINEGSARVDALLAILWDDGLGRQLVIRDKVNAVSAISSEASTKLDLMIKLPNTSGKVSSIVIDSIAKGHE